MVDALVRGFTFEVLIARSGYLQGKHTWDAVTQSLVEAAGSMASIFLGQNTGYHAPPWNSRERLGAHLKECFDWPDNTDLQEGVQVFFLRFAEFVLTWATREEQGAHSTFVATHHLVAALGEVCDHLFGAEPRVESNPGYLATPRLHPLLSVFPLGEVQVLVPFACPAFEQALFKVAPSAALSWDAGQSSFSVRRGTLGVLIAALAEHFPFRAFGQGEALAAGPLPYDPEDDPIFTLDDLQSHLDEWADLEFRRGIYDEAPRFFWKFLFVLKQNCYRLAMPAPKWLDHLLYVAPAPG